MSMILKIFEMYPRFLIMKIQCFEGMGPLSGKMASMHTSSQTPAYCELILVIRSKNISYAHYILKGWIMDARARY